MNRVTLSRLVVTFLALSLSGCFLVSDQELVVKGDEMNIPEGDYLFVSLELEKPKKPNYEKFSTKIKEPKTKKVTLVKGGNLFSKSYTYKLDDVEMKFKELDHRELKRIYLVQLSNLETLDDRTKSGSAEAKYAYFHAKFDNDQNLAVVPMFEGEKAAEDYFSKVPGVSLSTPDGNKEMDIGARKLSGEAKVLSKSLIKFASEKSTKTALSLFTIQPLCKGEKKSWNNCVGRTREQKLAGKPGEYSEIKIGPYANGAEDGAFFRKRVYVKDKDGKKPSPMLIAGTYKSGRPVEWWLYKRGKDFRRALKFENGKATYMKFSVKGYEMAGSLWVAEPPRIGTVKSGVENSGDQKLAGLFKKPEKGSARGSMTEGTTSKPGFEFVGTYEPIQEGRLTTKNKVVYSGKFDTDGNFQLGMMEDHKCENVGKFKVIKNRNNTSTSSNIEGMTTCKDGSKTIGKTSALCSAATWGGPSYKETKNWIFYGTTNATCANYERGVFIDKKTGEAFAVTTRPGENEFHKIKKVDIDSILRENNIETPELAPAPAKTAKPDAKRVARKAAPKPAAPAPTPAAAPAQPAPQQFGTPVPAGAATTGQNGLPASAAKYSKPGTTRAVDIRLRGRKIAGTCYCLKARVQNNALDVVQLNALKGQEIKDADGAAATFALFDCGVDRNPQLDPNLKLPKGEVASGWLCWKLPSQNYTPVSFELKGFSGPRYGKLSLAENNFGASLMAGGNTKPRASTSSKRQARTSTSAKKNSGKAKDVDVRITEKKSAGTCYCLKTRIQNNRLDMVNLNAFGSQKIKDADGAEAKFSLFDCGLKRNPQLDPNLKLPKGEVASGWSCWKLPSQNYTPVSFELKGFSGPRYAKIPIE